MGAPSLWRLLIQDAVDLSARDTHLLRDGAWPGPIGFECLHPGPVNALHSALIPTGPFGLGNPLSLALATHIGLESCEDSEHAEEGATSGGRSVHVLFEYLERGDHSTLWNAAATIRFQHDLQQVHHVIIVDSLRHLGQQPVVPNVVKVAPQIKILFRGFHGSLICYGLPGCSAPCTDLTGFPAIGAFYFQASNGLVALPVAGYDYSIDRTLCWRDFHPQEWQLDSLHNTRPS